MEGLWTYLLLCLPSVFIIVDPPGAIPVFLAMTRQNSRAEQAAMARRASMLSFGVLTVFAMSGNLLFNIFGITISALRIAGGIILFAVGQDMLTARPSPQRQTKEELEEGIEKPDIALVPLAIPILSGPGAIATVMSLGIEARSLWHTGVLVASISVTMLSAYLILANSHRVRQVLGETGLKILGRIMGLILATIAVQFVLDGFRDALVPMAETWMRTVQAH